MPTYSRTGYDGKLRDNLDGRYYNFGDRYVVRTNTEIVVSWTSNDLHGFFTVRTDEVTITDPCRKSTTIGETPLADRLTNTGEVYLPAAFFYFNS